ncbi:tRNA(Ile)(2)-agmatinylcytidine synthase [Halorussus marinus]|uniref:tRNA(Ile)(2)-agmatinylcytidine synthase n=1 Tax=Halorussus marinus TaxID=2505976 RepID=UPI00106F0511|nr:tRNA(Ile)(2)-agmatinylcytidine synthase [Halorussus marinus]
MTVIGIDDTDSRELGMCTTYLAARVAERVGAERRLLVRLNPAVEHKTRGNAALAIHTDADPDDAFEVAREAVAEAAATDDPRTNPGLVVAPGDPGAVPDSVAAFARRAVRERLDVEAAEAELDAAGYRHAGWKVGRGKIGALAAVGAWAGLGPAPDANGVDRDGSNAADGPGGEWTYECITYRERDRWGTPREVDADSVFEAADDAYPVVWDTVDRETGELVCVPHTPGPILHGIRGDDPDAVREVAEAIESEPVERRAVFVTNQGTDAHLRDAPLSAAANGRSYRTTGTVVDDPETRRGGHVFFAIEDGESRLDCAAFEPTKRFRDRVRALRAGDRITACGEASEDTLKLEKFAVRSLNRTELATPDCPDCGRSMESAGAGQGYRCRDCATTADGKIERAVDREIELGWYEVPPEARRHIARPLVRGGFDAPTHPER